MPTYDYICTSCDNRVEYFQKITESPKTECPECKGYLKRMVTVGAGVIFKGSGFYETDYKKRNRSENEKSGDSSTDNKTEKDTMAKKSEAKSGSAESIKEQKTD